MTTPASELCETMVVMATSPVLISALLICDLCCIIAAPLLAYWFVRILKMKLMHHNTRLLLCFHIAWLLIHVVGRSVLHTIDLLTYIQPYKSGCEILHTRIQCFILRLPYNIALISSNCSAIFVSIERLIATVYSRSYEGGFRNIGYFLLVSQVLVSSCALTVIYSPTRLDTTPLLYCQTTSTSNFMWTIYPFGFLLGMQFLSTVLFEVANKKNRRYSLTTSTGSDTLSRRYQIEENLWTIRTLKTYVYTNGTFNATYLIALSIVIFNNEAFSKPTYYALIEVFNVLYLYALALPLVLWYNRKDVHFQIRYAIERNLSANSNLIFEALAKQWNPRGVTSRNKISTMVARIFNKMIPGSKS